MAGYTKAENSTGVEFRVDPEPLKPLIDLKKALIIGAVLWIVGNIYIGFFGALMAFVLGGGLVSYLPWITRNRKPAQFTVTREWIEAEGRRIPVNEIQRLVVRNPMDAPVQRVTVDERAPAVGVVAGRIQRAQLQTKSYRVDVDSMGVPVTLAQGLTEPTASGLATEIAAITGLR